MTKRGEAFDEPPWSHGAKSHVQKPLAQVCADSPGMQSPREGTPETVVRRRFCRSLPAAWKGCCVRPKGWENLPLSCCWQKAENARRATPESGSVRCFLSTDGSSGRAN